MNIPAEERNAKVESLLREYIKVAKTKEIITYPSPFTVDEVETLFSNHIWGHREIILTILMATLLDPSFKASVNFYACNPRAIYENPIRHVLRENGIPHKKSGPLNVAKNSQRIDGVWAHNKRGDGMALIVAKLVKKIEAASPATLKKFVLAYVKRYLQEATKVEILKREIVKIEDPILLACLCTDLINCVPDGGGTPQFIVGSLMDNCNKGNKSPIITSDYADSVSTTNTTSKKPGDITETIPENGERIYEVTVKQFTNDRMIESYEAIKAAGFLEKTREVYVICKKDDAPDDGVTMLDSSFHFARAEYQGVIYYFVDIFEWINVSLLFTPPIGRAAFYKDLVEKINDINTSEKVKKFFGEWLKEHGML
jgi:hypothetical protein